VSVYAFEPAPGNFYLLSRNIELNGFDERIASFCIAFNDASRIDTFYMASTDLGAAMNTFGQATDWQGQPYTAKIKQSMLGFSIDDFIRSYGPLFPNHMKIDVDGIEKKIVDGAAQTLSDKRLRTVLVELNTDLEDCSEVIDAMRTHGLVLHKREHAPAVDSGPYSSVFNHIFVRGR